MDHDDWNWKRDLLAPLLIVAAFLILVLLTDPTLLSY